MKKVLSFILAVVMLVSLTAAVSANDIPDDYLFYQIDGMQRVFATSSIFENHTDIDSAIVFDHRTGTSLSFDFTDNETKTISLLIGSRECEKVEKLALLIEHDEETAVEVSFFATNDPEFKTWMPVNMSGENVISTDEDGNETLGENDDGWKVLNVNELSQGFAFYRIDFEMKSGEKFTLREVALFRTAEEPQNAEVTEPKTVVEKETWRKVRALTIGRLF